ncbi:MAG: DUF2182 domain-containing protein [Acidobacteriota bacterium]
MAAFEPATVALWRDRTIIVAGLAIVTATAWAYLVRLHAAPAHAMLDHGRAAPWGPSELLFAGVLWAMMVIAMMLPSASPMLLVFAAFSRRRLGSDPLTSTAMLALGYLLVWVGYSVAAVTLQWGLQRAAMASPAGVIASPRLAALFLLVAGIFQFTPLKHACLMKCRTPMAFIIHEWRPGRGGALVMGLRHGAYCVGCCWALMALMLVLGVMNLAWMAALTVFGLLEKIAPAPLWTGRIAGVALIAWAVIILVL